MDRMHIYAMPDFFTDPFNRAILIPLIGSLVLTTLIRIVGGSEFGPRFAAASVAVAYLWATGMVLGIPEFPPRFGEAAIAYLVVIAWLAGLARDLLHRDAKRGIWSELVLILICGAGAVYWLWGGLSTDLIKTLGQLTALVLWLIVTARIRWTAREARTPTLMIVAIALGLALVGLLAVLPLGRDLAAGIMAAAAGFLVLLLVGIRLHFTSSFLLPSMIALLAAGHRLTVAAEISGVTLLFLGLIPFADTVSRRIKGGSEFFRPTIQFLALTGLVLLPVLIAALGTLVELRFRY